MDLIFKTNHNISALEILEKVDKFYSESFTKLLWAMGWVIGIVGLLIPIIIHFIQYYSLKKEVNNLQNEILIKAENKISKEVLKLKTKFKKERVKQMKFSKALFENAYMLIDLKDKSKTEILTRLCRSIAYLIDAKVYDFDLEKQFRILDVVLEDSSIQNVDFNDKDLKDSFKKLKKKLKHKPKLWNRFSVRIEPIIQHIKEVKNKKASD